MTNITNTALLSSLTAFQTQLQTYNYDFINGSATIYACKTNGHLFIYRRLDPFLIPNTTNYTFYTFPGTLAYKSLLIALPFKTLLPDLNFDVDSDFPVFV